MKIKAIPKKIFQRAYKYFMLALLKVYKLKLLIHKKINGIKNPIIHVYSICWNEEKFLPLYLKHYCSFADKIIIYDNESTDNTLKILKENPKVEIKTYKTNGKLNDFEYLKIKNNAWKKSRGKADWVIVCDVDELLYPRQKQDITQTLQKTDKTIFKPEGYEMLSETFPTTDQPLTNQTKGVKSKWFDKKIIFNPHSIVEINYYPGCHEAEPIGIVKYGEQQFYLLHFKRMGLEYIINRYKTFANRMSKNNIEQKMGMHYFMKEKEITDEFYRMLKDAKQINQQQ